MHTKRARLGAGMAVTMALVVMAGSAAAQSTPSAVQPDSMPSVIHACYVPNTGTIYRIKTEDTRENCTTRVHIAFSWNQQGPQGNPGDPGPQGPPGTTDHSQLINLDNDDHPQYLLTEGVRDSPGGFTVRGTFTGGGHPRVQGAGTRLIWFPLRGAFRAGQVFGAEWDGANIGNHSVAMGRNTIASGDASTAMGSLARADGNRATAMGDRARASGDVSTAMGGETTASGLYSTAMGRNTIASGEHSTAMGIYSHASGAWSTALGTNTRASGVASTAMGFNTTASGGWSTAMGDWTTASGGVSTAMGSHASTNNRDGAFVYGDRSIAQTVNATAHNQFVVRAQHIWLGTNNNVTATAGRYLETSTGGYLSTGGSWVNSSSRHVKENFRAVDAEEVLQKVAELEVPSWNYTREEARVRHVGPLAQDFYHAFGLGGTDEAISTVDLGGINLLAIQALERRTAELRQKTDRIERLEAEVIELHAARAELERRLARLEGAPAAPPPATSGGAGTMFNPQPEPPAQ